jgi:hypothetical protein
MFWNAL